MESPLDIIKSDDRFYAIPPESTGTRITENVDIPVCGKMHIHGKFHIQGKSSHTGSEIGKKFTYRGKSSHTGSEISAPVCEISHTVCEKKNTGPTKQRIRQPARL